MSPSDIDGAFGSLRLSRQLETRQLFHLAEERRWFHLDRTANVEDTSQRGICLAELDEADESPLITGPCSKSLLTHFQPNTMFPQRLSERRGWIEFRTDLARRSHVSLWHRKYITRCL